MHDFGTEYTGSSVGIDLSPLPDELKSKAQFVLWKYEESSKGKAGQSRPTKVPYSPSNPPRRASTTKPEDWGTLTDLAGLFEQGGFDGVGYVFSEDDGIVGVDIDHCRNRATGEITEEAQEVIDRLNSYTEVSPSGEGLHIFIRAELPRGGNRKANVEMYNNDRYFTLTGQHLEGTPTSLEQRDEELAELHSSLFGKTMPLVGAQPPLEPQVSLTNQEVIQQLQEKYGERFTRLWEGDKSAYDDDDSRADLALVGMLSKVLGHAPERSDALFRQSGLMRAKWDEKRGKRTYGQITLEKALSDLPDVNKSDWGTLGELPAVIPQAPNMPVDLIPPPLKAWIKDAADRLCAPYEFIAIPAVCAAAAVLGRKVAIRPKQKDTWYEVPVLWGMIVADPSRWKTPSIQTGLEPLQALEKKAREEYELTLANNGVEIEVLQAEIAALRKSIEKSASEKDDHESIKNALKEKTERLEALSVAERRYTTQDGTVEKIAELLRENPNGLMVYRDELGGLFDTFHKKGRETERAFYLEGFNGKNPYTFDRIGRGTIHVPPVALSIMGGIQPGRLSKHTTEAVDGGSGADGLLQRFQLTVWPDEFPEWQLVDRPPDHEAKAAALQLFKRLDVSSAVELGAELDVFDVDAVPFLRYSKEAQSVFFEWYEACMKRLRSEEYASSPAYQAHMGKYSALVTRLSLVFHLLDVIAGKASGPVSANAAHLAVAWCEFLDGHAKKLYAIELHAPIDAAHSLRERIMQGEVPDGQTIRQIQRRQWRGLRTADDVKSTLRVLEAANWLRLESIIQGGRPSEVVRLHPDLL